MTPDYEKRTGRCAKCNTRLNPEGKCPYRKWLDHQPGKFKKTRNEQ